VRKKYLAADYADYADLKQFLMLGGRRPIYLYFAEAPIEGRLFGMLPYQSVFSTNPMALTSTKKSA
jgi:hypothetical protein